MTATDYYQILGVSPNATDDEIKRSYRRLARELHPDANGGDKETEERFKEVVLAYETLRDPERRRRYDMFGPDGARGAGSGQSDPFAAAGGFGDIFEAFFGQGGFSQGQRSGPVRGADAEATLVLEFEEAVFGAARDLSVKLAMICDACEGSGARPGTHPSSCPTCGGSGEVRRIRQSILGQMVSVSACSDCGGAGQKISSPCPECRGEGRRIREHSLRVDVPAGVDDGSTLRLPGRGQAGPRGGPAGDLYVHLRVKPHSVLRRSGYDLVATQSVSMTQAALGATLSVVTLEGEESIAVAPGTQPGTVTRLRGRGVPHLQGRGRGDLLVELAVQTPTGLNEAQELLLRQLAEERGEQVAPAGEGGILGRIRSRLR